MSKKSPAKRLNRPGGYFQVDREWFQSPAYRSLSSDARALLMEFLNLDQRQNGHLAISVERAAAMLNVSQNTIRKAFRQLYDRGFLEPTAEYSYTNGKARCYHLTLTPCRGREPTDAWRSWTPPAR
ncbi:MAG: hypothetical protein H3C28_00310 [Sphingomonadales bacterium]|nr:hypothetical protein [Sphingomonadales bacterium]